MRTCVIGHTGFVGSYLAAGLDAPATFNSANSEEMRGRAFDVVWCAGVSAVKWWANANPQEDWRAIERLLVNLLQVQCRQRFVLISTIDVHFANRHPYGRHRLLVEQFCRALFGDKLQVVRLPGLFGFGMKKNVIYDYLHGKPFFLQRGGRFQWYNIEWLRADLVRRKDEPLVELFPEPVDNADLADLFGVDLRAAESPTVYQVRPAAGYVQSRKLCLASIDRFVRRFRGCHRLNVSNLCGVDADWVELGIHMFEVAPYRLFGPGYASRPLSYFDRWADKGIYAFQSLFYPERWNLSSDFDAALAHLKRVCDIASYLGVRILSFGSPRLRNTDPGTLSRFFQAAARYLATKDGPTLCLEPNAREYGAEVLYRTSDVAVFVRTLDSPHIRLMVDVGCMLMSDESPFEQLVAHADLIQHVHFSSPSLRTCARDGALPRLMRTVHRLFDPSVRITLEMLNVTEAELVDSIRNCLRDPTVLIVGAGWYGCHLADWLQGRGIRTRLIDKTGIFSGASYLNQNRLHLGYHYPRSWATRQLCKRGFRKFMQTYGRLTREVRPNLYVISPRSMVDAKTFGQIMEAEGLPCTPVPGQTDVFAVGERFIDHVRAREYFCRRLVVDIEEFKGPPDQEAITFNCTNNEWAFLEPEEARTSYVLSAVLQTELDGRAITVMDGPFFSIFPWQSQLVTLTHVVHSHFDDGKRPSVKQIHASLDRMLEEARVTLDHFDRDYRYYSYFVSRKCRPTANSGDRSLLLRHEETVVHVSCAKITGIFDMQEALTRMWAP